MKKTRLSTILLLVLTLLCSIFILASCGRNDHSHNYSNEWSKDGTHHWQACSGCDEIRNKNEHDWNDGIVTTQPTETVEGVKTYTCNTCSHTKVESVPVLSHQHTYSDEWSSNGTHHWHAATCEHSDEKKDYAEHNWDAGVVTTEPTTTSKGLKTFTCETCGKTKTEDVPKLEESHTHTYDQQNTDTQYRLSEATCTQKAVYYYSCSCGLKGTATFEYGELAGHSFSTAWSYTDTHHWHAATCGHSDEKKDYAEHNWDAGVVTTEPTTTSKGLKTFTCDTCGKTKTEDVPKLEEVHTHNYNVQNANSDYKKSDATCTAKAEYYYSCSCGLQGTETFTYGDLAQHTYTTYTSNNDSTCLTDGTKTATCDVCHTETKTITDVGSATGHSYSLSWSSDETHHWHAATCEHSSEIKDKDTHHWDDGVVTKEPTKTEDGEKTYTCEVCQKTKISTIGKLDHVHTFASEYSYDDNYHWYAATCEHSSEVKDKASHNWDAGTVESQPTVYDEGVKLFTCLDCQHTKEETIDKLPSFTVIFYDANNKVISSRNYALNTTSNQILIPSVQAESGSEFDKWTDATTGRDFTSINFATAQENTAYHFEPNFVKNFTVVFVDYNGEQIGEILVVREGQKVKASDIPVIPDRTGYSSRWDINNIVGVSILENKVFSPVYEVLTYTVTFLDAKNGNVLDQQTVEYGSFALIPEYNEYAFTTKLYSFTGWKDSKTDAFVTGLTGNKVENIYCNMELYAVYSESITQPVVAIHINGTTVTMSLCMPDNTALYSINMSLAWQTEIGICEITGATISNVTPLNKGNCGEENCTVYTEKSDWVVYNNKAKTIDFVWNCGHGHAFNTSSNAITLTFGVDDGAQVVDEIFTLLENSTIVFGDIGGDIDSLEKSNIKVWFY